MCPNITRWLTYWCIKVSNTITPSDSLQNQQICAVIRKHIFTCMLLCVPRHIFLCWVLHFDRHAVTTDEQFSKPIVVLLDSINLYPKETCNSFLLPRRYYSIVVKCLSTQLANIILHNDYVKKHPQFQQTYLKKLSQDRSLSEFPSVPLHYVV